MRTMVLDLQRIGAISMKRMGLVTLVVAVLVLSACSTEVLTLDVGTCFDDPDTFDLVDSSDVPIVECDVPHDNEVYANEDLQGDDFPGRDGMATRADEVCLAEFASYIGTPYADSIYEFSWFVPSEESWDQGDREVICFAYDLNFDKITGSINGIGQ
jgi:hypothetical protein